MQKVYKLNGSVIDITKQHENFYINNFDAYELAIKLLEDTNDIDKVRTILRKMKFSLYVRKEDIDKFLRLFNYEIDKIKNDNKNKEVYTATTLTPSVLSYIDEFDKEKTEIENEMLLTKEDKFDSIVIEIINELFG